MGQRDFNVDERVHYIKNICCLNSLNWTIFHNLLHFDLIFFTKVKIITALEGFKLMAWKQDVGKIWIWWLLLIWLLIYDQIGVTSAFFFYFKKGFFFGGGGCHVQTRVDLPSGLCLRPALWFRNHLKSNISHDGWLWMLWLWIENSVKIWVIL